MHVKDLHVKDLIDYEQCADKIQAVLPGFEKADIADALEAYFQGSCSWEQDLVYNRDQAQEFIESLMVGFVAEQQNESRHAVKAALSLGMPIAPGTVCPCYPAGGLL